MRLLVVGGGGREHALAWKLAHSPRVSKVFVAPGNAGTAREPGCVNLPLTATSALIDFAWAEGISLTVIGPEAPLAAGVVDDFRAAGLRVFGPTRAAARLESSKAFAKDFMRRHGIPTAAYGRFTDPEQAHAYLREHGAPVVIKADGLAAGKGVVVATDLNEAHRAVDFMLREQGFGGAGAEVVIEEFLRGEEASFIVLADGRSALPLATSQDHKRLLDGDCGPNTGGMGAYSPAPVVTPEVHARVLREVIQPTLAGMAQDGLPYTGFLYAGLMIDEARGVKVLEYNCRLGDPEAQPLLMRLKSDLLGLLDAALDGRLDRTQAEWDRRMALGVVVAARGYPERPEAGAAIEALPEDTPELHVFHAGTALADGRLTVAGGRVVCVTGLADTVKMARKRAYDAAAEVRFDGAHYRSDIGHRALNLRRNG